MFIFVYIIGLIENNLLWAKWHQSASINFGLIENILVWSKLHQRAPRNLDWTKIV